jgi:hypothetical protein
MDKRYGTNNDQTARVAALTPDETTFKTAGGEDDPEAG